MSSKATITDIAKAAGVSTTTVSRYLNKKYSFMSELTREKISDAIESHHYIPNNVARALKSKESHLIGVITQTLKNQVAAQTIASINDVCEHAGYGTIVCCSDNRPDKELRAIEFCKNQQVDGLIIIPAVDDRKRYENIIEQGKPVVLVTRPVRGWKFGCVYVNHNDLIKRMIEHLKDNGFEKVLFINDGTDFLKKKIEDSYFKYASIAFDMSRSETCFSYERGDTALTQIDTAINSFTVKYKLQRKAIFAVNTPTLFLTLKILLNRKISFPDEIGVCGYDAIGWSQLIGGGISSIRHPMDKMGQLGAEELLKTIKDQDYKPQKIILGGTIKFMESTMGEGTIEI